MGLFEAVRDYEGDAEDGETVLKGGDRLFS